MHPSLGATAEAPLPAEPAADAEAAGRTEAVLLAAGLAAAAATGCAVAKGEAQAAVLPACTGWRRAAEGAAMTGAAGLCSACNRLGCTRTPGMPADSGTEMSPAPAVDASNPALVGKTY